MAEVCFVIQPFDGGKFDKRFDDVYRRAIVKAGLEAYRVDRDASASIPVQQIEQAISEAAVCLADITLDNPNVWFELGYAIASNKEICIICSEERKTPFPFDVQHRHIVKYSADSTQDFERLGQRIVERLRSIVEKRVALLKLPAASEAPRQSLNEMEVACMGAVALSAPGIDASVSNFMVKKEMEKLGYNGMGANVSLKALLARGLLINSRELDRYSEEIYEAYIITDLGWEWFYENLQLLNVKLNKTNRPFSFEKDLDDENPF